MTKKLCNFCRKIKYGGSAHECLDVVMPRLDNSAPRFVDKDGGLMSETKANHRARTLTRFFNPFTKGFSWSAVSNKELEASLNRRFA